MSEPIRYAITSAAGIPGATTSVSDAGEAVVAVATGKARLLVRDGAVLKGGGEDVAIKNPWGAPIGPSRVVALVPVDDDLFVHTWDD